MRNSGYVAGSRFGRNQRCVVKLVRKTERKEPLGRPRRRWQKNIKLILVEAP
jgi:hypothetical protein